MDNPRVSIITINFNNAAGLKSTMSSVIAQTSRDFEYIVIDGNSTDGSREVIEQNKEHLSFWLSENDKGIYDAMNKGITAAKGEYLLFINSGDTLYHEDTIEKMLPHLTGESIVYGNMKILRNGTITDGFMPAELSFSHMMRDTLWHPVSFIKKELFTLYGFYDTSFKICGDYDFFFKTVISKKEKVKHVSQFISVFDLTGISSLEKNAALIKQEKEKVQKQYLTEKEFSDFWKKENKKPNFFTRWFR